MSERKYSRGITNKQAKLLGELCRQTGEPYPHKLTSWQASVHIERLKRLIAAQRASILAEPPSSDQEPSSSPSPMP